MATSRGQSNGRSPLVNQQRQITAFFSKTTTNFPSPSPSPSPSSSPSPTLSNKLTPKVNTNPNSISKTSSNRSPNPSPATPSPLQSKPNKPLLLIGQSPSTPTSTTATEPSYGGEVVNKRVKVYWPLDKAWYEGSVKSFDVESGKHLVLYDDAEEEFLDLRKEKLEWVEEGCRRLKRLCRGSSLSHQRELVVEEAEDDEGGNVDDLEDESDDSSDEDWGKKGVEKEASEDEEEGMLLDDEVREEDGKRGSKKRKPPGDGKMGSGKKSKSDGVTSKGGLKFSVVEPVKNFESK